MFVGREFADRDKIILSLDEPRSVPGRSQLSPRQLFGIRKVYVMESQMPERIML